MKLYLKCGMILLVLTNSLSSEAFTYQNNTSLNEFDLIIKSKEESIGGTLVVPSSLKTRSLIIMSSGSGPQDRDETLEGFKIFKAIADHLASKGIASFRYDDRGVGTSTGDFVNSTIDDHSNDLLSIIDYFKSSTDHSFESFILFGHSQGGIIATKVARGNKSVKRVVLMGAPSAPLIEVVTYQVRQEYVNTLISQSLVEADVSAHNKLMRAIQDDRFIKEANKLFKETTESILIEMNTDNSWGLEEIKKKASSKADEHQIIYGLPSLTSFLYYDPSKDLEQLDIPVLSLFGGLDFQVPIHQNKDRMENALLKSGTNYEFKTFDSANHFFQNAKTGKREEYADLKKEFVDGFLDVISDWIIKKI